MSTIYHIQRDNQFMYYSTGNEKLNYTVQDEKAVFNKTDNCDTFEPSIRLSYYDISNIDTENCTFNDFCKVAKFAKESYSGYDYDETYLASFKDGFKEDENYNFYTWFEDYRLNCARRGDLQEYHNVIPLEQIAYTMSHLSDSKLNNKLDLTDDGYFKYDVFNNVCCTGFDGSYELGRCILNIDGSYYDIYAEYDIESTSANPIIVISFRNFDTGQDLNGKYTVEINDIDLNKATPLELFAYFSYNDSLQNEDWYKFSPNTDNMFKRIIDSGVLELESLNDFTDKTYNLQKILTDAVTNMNNYKSSNSSGMKEKIDFSTAKIQFTKEYIEKCLKTYEDLLISLGLK